MRPVRFGIIACSSVARRLFIPALRASAKGQLERIGSRDPAKAAQYAAEFSCSKFGSYEDVLNDSDVDAVYISLPCLLHQEWVLKAADRGKHVLCEKPAFPDYAAAVKAAAVCRSSSVLLMENYAFKYHPQHARVADLIASDRIGKALYFQGEFTYPLPDKGDIRLNPDLGGGVFYDSAGYPVAAALHQMKGKPVSVSSQRGRNGAIDSSFAMLLNLEGGVTVHALVSFGAFYRSRYSILGSKGRIELLRAYAVPVQMRTSLLVETEAGEEKIEIEPANQFQLLLDAFCTRLSGPNSTNDVFDPQLLLRHAVMDAARRSDLEKRTIQFSEYDL